MTEDMLDGTVEQTNLYAQQFMDATSLPPHSRVHGWNNRAKEVSGNDHHHGPGKLSSHRGLLGYVLAILNYYFLKGIYIPILPCTYILCTHADLHVQCHVYININE